ncbi:MAG TPA: acyl-CoA dehydrogenase family protein [Amycolatopsis sp.]|nr:acyl-CoA dehydrogenase family protein [Amycolatopsis sp.]
MDFFLTKDELAFRDAVRDWADAKWPRQRARELDEKGEFPTELWDDMAAMGFHGIGVSEEYGGQGGDVVTQVLLAQGLSRNLAGLATMWGVPSFAGAKSVGLYGSPEHKERFLPDLAAGRSRFAIAITEPDGGTDLLGRMRTHARRADGGWVITGQKIWSTGAHVADYILVLAKSEDDAPVSRSMTLFLVPTNSDGLSMRQIPKLGIKPFASNEIFFDDVFVPDDLVFGERGGGWKLLVGTLNNERIMTAGFAAGVLDGVLEVAVEYLNQREAFGRTIGHYQALQHYIADIRAWKAQSELLALYAARMQSAGKECGTEATMAKMVSAEYANKAADLGIQMLGGMGYAMETDMQRFWRDSRIYRIAPITTEMAKNIVAQSCGLPRSY